MDMHRCLHFNWFGLHRPSKYPKFYTTKFQVKKKAFTPKRAQIFTKLKLPQIVVIPKLYIVINNFNKIGYKYLVTKLLKLLKKISISLNLLQKEHKNATQKRVYYKTKYV